MYLNEAIKIRMEELLHEKNISSKYQLSCNAGLNPSLLTDFFNNRTLYPRVDTLFLFCEAMDITLEVFFCSSLFDIENIEIQDTKNFSLR